MISIVLINNNWEQVKDLSDIIRIVKENIGDEFTREVERICGDYEFKINELDEENYLLRNQIVNLKEGQNKLRKLFFNITNSLQDITEVLDDFDLIIGD